MKKVLVKWVDSNVLHGWQYGEYPAELALCDTLGYLVHQDSEKIVVAQTISEMGANMGITIIAKGAVKSVTELRVR